MRSGSGFLSAIFAIAFVLSALSTPTFAQVQDSGEIAAAQLPDAPRPHLELAELDPPAPQGQTQGAQGSSNSQSAVPQAAGEKSQHEKAEEQLKEQEKQRVVGILPAFNVSYRSDAASLTAGQKFSLALHSSVDPVTFATAFLVAGYHEIKDDDTGFGWGVSGYGKRAGAAYLDTVDGTMIGNFVLPAILHQDPRYFRLGHGTISHRFLYSLATNVMCKHDNTGKWEPNYSNVAGNIASGAISNLYYPPTSSGFGQTFTNGLVVTAEGAIGSIFEEFWPDVSRRFLHRDPTHGLDAQERAADQAKKQIEHNQE
jgi:hypothetical protein